MARARLALVLAALLLTVPASAQVSLSGLWKIEVIGGPAFVFRAFEMPSALELKTDGTKLTGMARMGDWPGDCPVEGSIKADEFSFTAASHVSSAGFAKMGFTGTVKGDRITLTMESLGFASCPTCNDESEMGNRLSQRVEMVGQRTNN